MALCQKFGRLLIGVEARFSARTGVTNISTRLNQSSAPTQIPSRLPSYKKLNAFSLFTKDQLAGQSGDPKLLKIVSTNWKNLSEKEKQNYYERAKKIGDELRDKFEKLTNEEKKDLWDKHVEKRDKRRRLQMKRKLQKHVLQTEPIKTRDERNKIFVETSEQWQQMTDAEKQPYVVQGQCNIAKFRVEMAEWKRKYANEIRAWKEAKAKATQKARDAQFTEALFDWNIDGDRDVDEKEAIHQMLLEDSTHLVEKRERSSDDRDVDEEAIQRMFLAISTYLGRKETSQNQRNICDLHRSIAGNTFWAGKFRECIVWVGDFIIPTGPAEVPGKMRDLVAWINEQEKLNRQGQGMSIVWLATHAMHKLLLLHPFMDCNGRVSRLVMNLLLHRAGFGPFGATDSAPTFLLPLIVKEGGIDVERLLSFVERETETSSNWRERANERGETDRYTAQYFDSN
uniref:Fido domain-containing protein n=1 Tax=Globodera rostochiensis TaxID=31243 RepID=A0A914GXI1_GLORO